MSRQRYQHGGNIWDKPQPLAWLDFSANINPWGPPQAMLDAISLALPALNHYPDPQATAATNAVAAYLQVPRENLLLTNGGLAGLELVVNYLQPAAAAICQPTFVEYERLCHLHEVPVNNLHCLQQRREFRLPREELQTISSGSLVFLCNPVNPCGTLVDLGQIQELLQTVKARSSRLLLDEAFIDFIPGASARQIALTDEHLLIAGSLTKLFAIPGLRLGYLIGSASLVEELRYRQTPWSLNLLAQAAAKTLPTLSDFVQDSLKRITAAREELINGLSQLKITALPSQANFLLVDFQSWGLTASAINNRLHDKRMQIRDCSNFVGLDDCFARIAVLSPTANRRLLASLEEIKCGI